MLIAAAMAFNYVITVENIPKTLAIMLKGYELTPFTFLLLANLILLVLGCFLEGTTILLIIVPVLLPTAQALGVTPYGKGTPLQSSRWRWSASASWALAASLLMGVALMQLGKFSPFLYFQF